MTTGKSRLIALNRNAWDAIGETLVSPYVDHPHYSTLFKSFCETLPDGASLLDLGCGPGEPVTRMLVDHGFNVTGIDFSERMIRVAREKLPTVAFICQSMTELTHVSEFDGLVASYSLLCLDPSDFVVVAKKIAMALKPWGFCFVALNERELEDSTEHGELARIGGQLMYSRAYSEGEIRDAFADLKLVAMDRGIVNSDMFGKESGIAMVFQKSTPVR